MNSVTRLKALSLHQDISFGLDGNDAPFLGEGWADAGVGRRSILGAAGEIRMIHPGSTDLLLEVAATMAGTIGQRIEIDMNGQLAATIDLPDPSPRAAYIPAGHVPPGQILTLRLRPPANGRTGVPATALSRLRLFTLRRQIATSAQSGAAGGVTPRTILGFFESLGDTYEFGAVQQNAGVRKSGLLPCLFASPPALLRAIDAGFAGLGDAETFDVVLHPHNAHDYTATDTIYGADFRGLHEAGEIRLSAFIERQGARLRDARRGLMRTMATGEKIFVIYRGAAGSELTEQEVLAVLIALNRHGPTYLLWVTPANAANPPGIVQQKIPFLLHGTIERFQVGPDIGTIFFDTWLKLCRKAVEIAFPSGAPGAAQVDALEHPTRLPSPAGRPGNPPEEGSQHGLSGANPPTADTGSRVALQPVASPALPPAAPSSRDGNYALLQSWRFGDDGNEEAVLGFGWSGPEDGFRWTDGPACELWLDHPGKRDVFVVVEAWPFVMPTELPVQRAEFSAHDAPLGTLAFTETSRLALPVAASALRPGRVMRLRCELPDATRPSETSLASEDARQLGLGFRRVAVHVAPPRVPRLQTGSGGISIEEALHRTGLAQADFLARFEPLGETPVLTDLLGESAPETQGLFHRAALGPLDLMLGLDSRFEGVGDPAKLQAELIGGDPELYEIRDESTGLSYVVERAKSDASPEMLAARQARRLKFLRDQLLHDLSTGQKIFVFHRPLQEAAPTEPEMLALLISLRQHGPATLLFLTAADGLHPPGTVEQLYPGLLQGYVTDAEPDLEAVWFEVLANALALSI